MDTLSNGLEPTLSGLVLLLLGKKQSGKSSAGNAILNRRAFHQKTSRSCRENGTVFGLQVTVVDTPGWLSPSTTPHKVSREICRGLTFCHPGPHAILLVLPTCSTFGLEEWSAMEAQFRQLETSIWQHTMILFTHGDQLGGLSIQDYIRQQGGSLQWLLERCQNRYQVMSSHSAESQAQVMELFQKIQRMAEAPKHPRVVQYRAQIPMSRDVSMRGEQRWNMKEMNGRQHMASRWPPSSIGVASGRTGWNPDISLILLGRRKSGKSSAGNMILNREQFQRGIKTTSSSAGHAEISGRSVTVVDTPGWSLFGLANPEQVRKGILQSPSLCPTGSRKTFLLVIPVDSFKEKDRRAIETNLSVLGDEVWRCTMVLFTFGEELRGSTVEKYIKNKGEPLRWVLERCGCHYHVCDTQKKDKEQVNQLLGLVEKM
ncbi:GTPase IMAP family member 8-like [Melanotaenia boesemani]|uniref:GTPase IMAP family member 8-like n=1 Tax=Melanotaenia boesemani TaxID=1250792 RepID=UPI001C040B66|nr:GTPase IMAP family member 8-like [Melanotaenia boesemani]